MSVKFACHHCGQRLSVSDEKVGQKAKCPKCRGPIAVPTQEAGAAQLAEIRASREDAEVEDVFAEFGSNQVAQPRNLSIVTGTSGTADIEAKNVRGAHGPRFMHLILVG